MVNLKTSFPIMLLLLATLLGACQPLGDEKPSRTSVVPSQTVETLTVITHDSFEVSEDVVRSFEETNNARLVFLKSGDTGSALNRAILSMDSLQADVFYGVDNTFLARALDAGIFDAYASPMLEKVPAEFILDPTKRALPVDYGDVCINYDKAYFAQKNLAPPQNLLDLLLPEYKGLLVVENPAISSPGLAFLLATIAYFGTDGYLSYWAQLKDNGVVVVNDWETAYYTNFSASSGRGAQPMVVSYGSSPAAEVIFAEKPIEEAPTGLIVSAGSCFRQIEFVGILKGTTRRSLAEKFVDFMLSLPFQEDIPGQMFMFPVNSDAQLSDVFILNVQIPEEPASIDPVQIAQHREEWINAWMEVVLYE